MIVLVFTPPKRYSNEKIFALQQPLMNVVGVRKKIGKLANVHNCANDVLF